MATLSLCDSRATGFPPKSSWTSLVASPSELAEPKMKPKNQFSVCRTNFRFAHVRVYFDPPRPKPWRGPFRKSNRIGFAKPLYYYWFVSNKALSWLTLVLWPQWPRGFCTEERSQCNDQLHRPSRPSWPFRSGLQRFRCEEFSSCCLYLHSWTRIPSLPNKHVLWDSFFAKWENNLWNRRLWLGDFIESVYQVGYTFSVWLSFRRCTHLVSGSVCEKKNGWQSIWTNTVERERERERYQVQRALSISFSTEMGKTACD